MFQKAGRRDRLARRRWWNPRYSQEEYIREQMDWREISFADNQPCINLISLKPYGILRILDDQCCFPQVNRRCSCAWNPRLMGRG